MNPNKNHYALPFMIGLLFVGLILVAALLVALNFGPPSGQISDGGPVDQPGQTTADPTTQVGLFILLGACLSVIVVIGYRTIGARRKSKKPRSGRRRGRQQQGVFAQRAAAGATALTIEAEEDASEEQPEAVFRPRAGRGSWLARRTGGLATEEPRFVVSAEPLQHHRKPRRALRFSFFGRRKPAPEAEALGPAKGEAPILFAVRPGRFARLRRRGNVVAVGLESGAPGTARPPALVLGPEFSQPIVLEPNQPGLVRRLLARRQPMVSSVGLDTVEPTRSGLDSLPDRAPEQGTTGPIRPGRKRPPRRVSRPVTAGLMAAAGVAAVLLIARPWQVLNRIAQPPTPSAVIVPSPSPSVPPSAPVMATPAPSVPPSAPATATPAPSVPPSAPVTATPAPSTPPSASPTGSPAETPTAEPTSVYEARRAALPECPNLVRCRQYTVVHNDTLTRIGGYFGVSVAALKDLNPEIADPNLIHPGQVVRIPN